MQFPNNLQSAILFDRQVNALESIVRTFLSVSQAKNGLTFNVPEAKPGVFYRLFGRNNMTVTLEYVNSPPAPEPLQQALGSTVKGIYCPDVREHLIRSKSLILVNVSHGVLGGLDRKPEFASLFESIGLIEGASQPEFLARLDMLALLTRIVCDQLPATLVHWTQSNQLVPATLFDSMAAAPEPGPLSVHPYLFGREKDATGKPMVGIRTFGVRHFLGREVIVEPNILPWTENYQVILSFLRIATVPNGYVIPHDDTFGPEGGGLSYRCIHHDTPEEGDVPLYELAPLRHDEFGFLSPDYVPEERVIDDRTPPASVMPHSDGDKAEILSEWREKRALAEGLGGRFEVRARGTQPLPPPAPPQAGPLRRPLFGRKGIGG